MFGGETEFITAGDRDSGDVPRDAVFHSELKGGNLALMAADAVPADGSSTGGNRISLHILCADKAELDRYFEELSAGGTVRCSVCPAFGGLFAMTTDRYGLAWYLTSLGVKLE